MLAVIFAIAAAGAALQSPPAVRNDACRLLAVEEISAVQDSPVKERKGSRQTGKRLVFDQCFFVAADFPQSVSLTVISSEAAGRARGYWESTFHRQAPPAGGAAPPVRVKVGKRKNPPRSVGGTGDEAFWTGDARAGTLYVLSGDLIIGVSVGGTSSEEERIRRSTTLAQAAVARLRQRQKAL